MEYTKETERSKKKKTRTLSYRDLGGIAERQCGNGAIVRHGTLDLNFLVK